MHVYVDVNNLTFNMSKRYPGYRIQYSQLFDYISSLGDYEVCNIYTGEEASNNEPLAQYGEIISRPPEIWSRSYDASVVIARHMSICQPRHVVICSNHIKLAPLYMEMKDTQFIVIACNISRVLQPLVRHTVEIQNQWMEQIDADASNAGTVLPDLQFGDGSESTS